MVALLLTSPLSNISDGQFSLLAITRLNSICDYDENIITQEHTPSPHTV
jgi:hypothetical protein